MKTDLCGVGLTECSRLMRIGPRLMSQVSGIVKTTVPMKGRGSRGARPRAGPIPCRGMSPYGRQDAQGPPPGGTANGTQPVRRAQTDHHRALAQRVVRYADRGRHSLARRTLTSCRFCRKLLAAIGACSLTLLRFPPLAVVGLGMFGDPVPGTTAGPKRPVRWASRGCPKPVSRPELIPPPVKIA